MAILCYDANNVIQQLIQAGDGRQPSPTFTQLFINDTETALIADILANWNRYSIIGGVLNKDGVPVTFSNALTLDQKLAAITDIAKTLAAVVEVLVAQYGATPTAGTPAWAKTQLANAHAFIKNQGG